MMIRKIAKMILFLAICWTGFHIQATGAEAPVQPIQYTKPVVIDMIGYYASKYGVSQRIMTSVVSCETGGTFDPKQKGDHGHSLGLSQIYLPAHPDITPDQAQDPDFALEFMASNLAKGNGSLWTTYTAIKNGGSYTFWYPLEQKHMTIYCKA